MAKRRVKTKINNLKDSSPEEFLEKGNTTFTKYRSPEIYSDEDSFAESIETTKHDSPRHKPSNTFPQNKKNFNLGSSFKHHRSAEKSDDEDDDQSAESNDDFKAVTETTTPDKISRDPITKEIVLDTKQNILETAKPETLSDEGQLMNTELEVLGTQLTEVDVKLENMVVKETADASTSKSSPISWKELEENLSAVKPKTTGKEALKIHNKQKQLIMVKLKNLYETNHPKDNTSARDVLPKRALTWIIWRESQEPPGGILADDMDIGKTLSMISLLKMKKSEHEDNEKEKHRKSEMEGGTLLICPATLIEEWESEISKECKLNVEIHRGPERETEATRLAKYDVVITTYRLVMGEHAKRGPLYGVKWRRIILDQAHIIRNHKTKTSVAVCDLIARSRWALTGTPIHNKELDLYALLKFLRCSPFDDLHIWKRWLDNNEHGLVIINFIMTSIMLRITKEELQIEGSFDKLPERKYEVISAQLDPAAKNIYQKILVFSKTLLIQFLRQRNENIKAAYKAKSKPPGSTENASDNPQDKFNKLRENILKIYGTQKIKSHEILVYLLRLRQICCHPSLISSMLNDEYSPEDGIEEDGIDIDILDKLNNLNLDDEVHDTSGESKAGKLIEDASKVLNTSNPVFEKHEENEKIRIAKQIIKEKVIPKGDKIIVASQWTGMLKIVGEQLSNDNIPFKVLDGSVSASKRSKIVKKFNNSSSTEKVLLLSLTATGVGFNLVGANHLLLLDFHWNPQFEVQVQDRIYRIGQKKTVHIYKIVTTDTIEERIKALQETKLSMANDILTTASSANKLSLDDLKMLFSINDEL